MEEIRTIWISEVKKSFANGCHVHITKIKLFGFLTMEKGKAFEKFKKIAVKE